MKGASFSYSVRYTVMAGLDPAIHVFAAIKKSWITGSSPVMTI